MIPWLNIIACVGMTICFFVTLFIIYSVLWRWSIENWVRRNRRNRRNRISPEMFEVLSRVIRERNIITRLEQEHAREIELTEIRNKNKHTVIVINPDEKIQIGTI